MAVETVRVAYAVSRTSSSLTTMSAMLLQLTGHSRPSILRMQPLFRISRRISNYHFATPSWSSTFGRRKPLAITGTFATFRDRPIFTPALLSLRHHPPQNPPQPKARIFFDLNKIPENVVFYGIIGINCVVFMMWYMAEQKFVSYPAICVVLIFNLQTIETTRRSVGYLIYEAKLFK